MSFFAGAARNLEGKASAEWDGVHTSLIRREAIGVVGSIAPWNYPLQMAMWKILPAIAAGNTIVLKPAEITPLTSLMLAEDCIAAGIPAGVVNVVVGAGLEAGEALVGHPSVDMVSFTGSTPVGKRVMELATASVKRVHLELGGKAPFVVFDDADLEAAVHGAVAGSLINSGQDCTAATRAYVQRPLYEAFVSGVADLFARVRIGAPEDPATDLGPLISARQAERVAGFVDRARGYGARVVTGGAAPGGDLARGAYYQPTLVTDVAQDSEIVQNEIFGPVLVVLPFDSDDEGIALANDTVYGLAASAWTTGIFRGLRAQREIRAGCVWINDHIPIVSEMPHGGFGQSGFRQGYVHVLVRGVHERQARVDGHHGGCPQAVAPHDLHRPLVPPSSTYRRNAHDHQAPRSHRRHRRDACGPRSPAVACCRRPDSAARRWWPRPAGPAAMRVPRRRVRPSAAAAEDMSDTDKAANWSNWPLYIDIDDETGERPTLEAFQKETGIAVTYTEDVNDNNEFYAKVRTQLEQGQDIGRDIVVLTDWMAALWIQNGYAQKLDKAIMPNSGNIIPRLASVSFDPSREYTLPWQSGIGGLGYNVASYKEATGKDKLTTLDELFDPALKGRVTVLSEMRDTMGVIIASQGNDPSNFTEDQFNQAIEELTKQVDNGQIRQVTGNDYIARARVRRRHRRHRLVGRHLRARRRVRLRDPRDAAARSGPTTCSSRRSRSTRRTPS